MPYKFRFKINGHTHFECLVHSRRCQGNTKTGARCGRKVIIGFEYCFQHLKSERHLNIKQSTIPDAGKGLFAYDPRNKGQGNAVVFGPKYPAADDSNTFERSRITIYHGQLIDNEELEERYDNHTGPYAVRLNEDEAVDSASLRGVGSLANQARNHREQNARLTVYNHAPLQDRARLLADQVIRNGDGILIDYGDEYRLNEPGVSYSTLPR